MYPILLNLSQQNCLIVGGGPVAARKVEGLLRAGATRIHAVAPEFCAAFSTAVERTVANYASSHLDGISLIFAATNRSDVNDQIVRDARERHILCTRADSSEELAGDFTLPAYWQDDSVMVTVSAGSAALSARLRDELQAMWRPLWTRMAEAMKTLRPELKQRFDEPTRRKMFRLLTEDDAFSTLDRGGIDALREYVVQHAKL